MESCNSFRSCPIMSVSKNSLRSTVSDFWHLRLCSNYVFMTHTQMPYTNIFVLRIYIDKGLNNWVGAKVAGVYASDKATAKCCPFIVCVSVNCTRNERNVMCASHVLEPNKNLTTSDKLPNSVRKYKRPSKSKKKRK